MPTETIRLIRWGGGGMEVGGEIDYILIATLSPPEWLLHYNGLQQEPFSCFINCKGQSHKTASTDHNFWRERRAGMDSNQGPSAYQPNALLLGQTGSLAGSPRYLLNILTNTVTEALTLQPCVHRTIKLLLLLHHSNIKNKHKKLFLSSSSCDESKSFRFATYNASVLRICFL